MPSQRWPAGLCGSRHVHTVQARVSSELLRPSDGFGSCAHCGAGRNPGRERAGRVVPLAVTLTERADTLTRVLYGAKKHVEYPGMTGAVPQDVLCTCTHPAAIHLLCLHCCAQQPHTSSLSIWMCHTALKHHVVLSRVSQRPPNKDSHTTKTSRSCRWWCVACGPWCMIGLLHSSKGMIRACWMCT